MRPPIFRFFWVKQVLLIREHITSNFGYLWGAKNLALILDLFILFLLFSLIVENQISSQLSGNCTSKFRQHNHLHLLYYILIYFILGGVVFWLVGWFLFWVGFLGFFFVVGFLGGFFCLVWFFCFNSDYFGSLIQGVFLPVGNDQEEEFQHPPQECLVYKSTENTIYY